jgi:hypothetical protein
MSIHKVESKYQRPPGEIVSLEEGLSLAFSQIPGTNLYRLSLLVVTKHGETVYYQVLRDAVIAFSENDEVYEMMKAYAGEKPAILFRDVPQLIPTTAITVHIES